MPKFTAAVLKRIRKAGIVERDYRIDDLEDDLDALAELNAEIQFDLLDTRPHRRGEFRWYDRSLQEFFAAWWLSRYADKKQGDLGRLREWRYDDPRDDTARTLYQPLWGFLTEMPKAVRRERIWASAVGLLYERGAPRCCEMIYRSWRPMWRCRAGRPYLRDWQQEFKTILATPGPEGEVAQALCRNSRRSGFRRCPKDPADDYTPFLMGSPETEKERFQDELLHTVVVTPFLMHEFPVTNAQYELFDPAHQQERLGNLPESEARDHPVVNVTWFQAWCFARWTGNHLPTEAEWEYACRGGAPSNQPFHFGDSLSSKQANFDGKYPYGGADKGQYLERTTKVGSYQRNAFELYDMHGNVWEWCADWYGARYYEKSRQKDPRGPRVASARVLRGGGWLDSGRSCRSALRYRNEPDDRYRNDGFRLAAVPCAVGAQQGEPGQA